MSRNIRLSAYIEALRRYDHPALEAQGRTQHLLMSFHVSERYFHNGDPYFCKFQKTRDCSLTSCC